ncbi:rhodanese-like domain-containing protein [Maribellus sp. CM-23]|uniref:rhodanese-like domain-containing protein n=1 Tax=Maribellus sp. CM-23 TaxID=2781026 RepID=UPI001F2A7190|nr:rhodanese-like domain-containing protein [Maribellus sp. CM-23]MCE4563627.1 rhodanese-like domain-containing protein [Maribellus sp. CM-23]
MNRNYIFLTLLMLVLAVGTVFLTMDDEPNQVDPEILLQEIIQPTRYVSTDQVAKMIIQGDPSLMLIDVRSEDDFQGYSLPHSINIPLDSLLTADNLSYFGIPGTKVVFVSDDDIRADQMWVLTKRLGYKGTYVMRGGLNCWMQTIIEPKQPSDDASYADMETYSFRKGAQIYFTGAEEETSDDSKVEVQVQKREKTNVALGGC